MKPTRWTQRVRRGVGIACLTLLWWLLLAPLQPVFAHGDDRVLQLTTVAGDDFHLTVWSAPGILRTGEIHLITAVNTTTANDGQDAPRTDVLVQVQLIPLETDGTHMTTLAYPIVDASGANTLQTAPVILHEAALIVTAPGRYQVQIDVVDSTGKGGAASFPIAVVTVPVWFKGLLYVQGVLALGVGLLLLRQGQRLWFGHQAQA